jgi:hypothetical protein
VVAPIAPGIVVYLDSVDVSDGIGFGAAVDPGEYKLEALAPGHVTWTATIRTSGEGQTVSVYVPSLQPVRVTVSAPVAAPPGVAAIGDPAPRAQDAPRSRGRRAVALGLGGAALLAFGGAIATELWGQSLLAEAKAAPTQARADELRDVANRPHYVAQGLAIAGAGLAAASAYLWFTREEPGTPPRKRFDVTPVVGAGGVQAAVHGTF